jgi:hypothetical protein
MVSSKFMLDAHLQEPGFLQRCFHLYNLLCMNLSRTILGNQNAVDSKISMKSLLPSIESYVNKNFKYDPVQSLQTINDEVPNLSEDERLFTLLPEWLVEDILDFHLFVLRQALITSRFVWI